MHVHTVRRVWKIGIFSLCIIEYTCVMNRSRPSSNNKCKSHIKIANCHDILSCRTFPVAILGLLTSRHNTFNVCSIYCPNGILEVRPKSCFFKRVMNLGERSIFRLNVISGHTVDTEQDLLKFFVDGRPTVFKSIGDIVGGLA